MRKLLFIPGIVLLVVGAALLALNQLALVEALTGFTLFIAYIAIAAVGAGLTAYSFVAPRTQVKAQT